MELAERSGGVEFMRERCVMTTILPHASRSSARRLRLAQFLPRLYSNGALLLKTFQTDGKSFRLWPGKPRTADRKRRHRQFREQVRRGLLGHGFTPRAGLATEALAYNFASACSRAANWVSFTNRRSPTPQDRSLVAQCHSVATQVGLLVLQKFAGPDQFFPLSLQLSGVAFDRSSRGLGPDLGRRSFVAPGWPAWLRRVTDLHRAQASFVDPEICLGLRRTSAMSASSRARSSANAFTFGRGVASRGDLVSPRRRLTEREDDDFGHRQRTTVPARHGNVTVVAIAGFFLAAWASRVRLRPCSRSLAAMAENTVRLRPNSSGFDYRRWGQPRHPRETCRRDRVAPPRRYPEFNGTADATTPPGPPPRLPHRPGRSCGRRRPRARRSADATRLRGARLLYQCCAPCRAPWCSAPLSSIS